MVRKQLSDAQWAKVEAVLTSKRGRGRPPKDNRNFIEAVLWWRRTSVPWRDLPDDFGPWQTVLNRFDRWAKSGKWTRLFHKVHIVVDALGLPVTFEITEGQRHDSKPAKMLVARVMSRCLLADKAYDSDDLRAALQERNGNAVIPSNRSRAQKIAYDKELYKARSEVECTFSLLKQARRFATRYEKTLRNYAAVVAIDCALLWLRI